MTARGPIQATARDGQVVIVCDPRTARDLSDALAAAYATCPSLEVDRPHWMSDVVDLARAAATADIQAGRVPETVLVPLLPRRPILTVLAGGESA